MKLRLELSRQSTGNIRSVLGWAHVGASLDHPDQGGLGTRLPTSLVLFP